MAAFPVIVVGASEGGVAALRALIGALPADLSAAVFVVQHIGAHDSHLPDLLGGPLPSVHAETGDRIHQRRVYVAPPDHHMIVTDGLVRLTKGPRENFVRPSIDPLFRSAAEAYGSAAIGVILTGGLNDGTAGLYEIKRRGGVTIVQDPADALNPSMPRSALKHVAVDHCTPLALMPRLLTRIAAELAANMTGDIQLANQEVEVAAGYSLGRPVALTCPDCGGALQQTNLGTLTQFRCHIGHIYTSDVIVDGQFNAMLQTIEAAMRSVNERAEICRRMAEQDEEAEETTMLWRRALKEASATADSLKALLEHDWMDPDMTNSERA
jgi:two-component system chemotaxis response regulator CheB